MRASSVAFVVVLFGSVAAVPAFGADGGAPSPNVVQPYDEPGAEAPPAVVPIPPAPLAEKPTPRVAPRPQATDGETPRRPKVLPLAPGLPPVERRAFDPDPSEPGRIVGESIVAFLTADLGLVMGAVAGFWPILAVPLVTGGVVCAIGSGSNDFDGSCGAAIGGAYLGSLLAIPAGFLFAGQGSGSGDALPPAFVGVVLGFVVGSAAGAVVGWNVSREPKVRRDPDLARLDALAASRALAWREPLRPRGSLLEGSEPRLAVPLLAFRF